MSEVSPTDLQPGDRVTGYRLPRSRMEFDLHGTIDFVTQPTASSPTVQIFLRGNSVPHAVLPTATVFLAD